MYINQLIDAYKEKKNYIQDKQIAHDLGVSTQKLSNIRQGSRYLTENEALFLAEEVGADKEMVLVYLAADKAKTYEAQTLWNNIAKKYNGLGLQKLSLAISGLAFWIGHPTEAIAKCALCELMFNGTGITKKYIFINSLIFERDVNEVSRNDKKLYFS